MKIPHFHHFEARYDEKWTTVVEELVDKGCDLQEVSSSIPYLKEKVYIHDVCVKCGQIANREGK